MMQVQNMKIHLVQNLDHCAAVGHRISQTVPQYTAIGVATIAVLA